MALSFIEDASLKNPLDLSSRLLGASSLTAGPVTAGPQGEVRATGNVTAYFVSDRRLKENIVTIPNALSRVQAINGVTFDWNDEEIARRGGADGYFVRKHDVGLIAQDVEQALPEATATRIDGYMAVRYELVVPLLVEAVKELSAQVAELQRQLGQ